MSDELFWFLTAGGLSLGRPRAREPGFGGLLPFSRDETAFAGLRILPSARPILW
jgi:hypothetical protein